MKRFRLVIAGSTALLLGGGLLGWHVYLDRTGYRPPAVNLSHGECRGTLDAPGFAALLGHTPRVFVETGFRVPARDGVPGLDCRVEGQGGRVLQVMAAGAAYPGNGLDGEVSFGCTLNGKNEPYRAALRFSPDFPSADRPDQVHVTELLTGFAVRAAQELGCANGAESVTAV
ncbi:hypothetical protein ACIQI7_08305 [Kitasatospora sp. NPDC092039]|uniref:hypothetical protein n=1 Tax=Kitasatospora sp. NPDC092039 TaxID=3364086 RepID=UPI00382CBE02